jgi:hypothetical protein
MLFIVRNTKIQSVCRIQNCSNIKADGTLTAVLYKVKQFLADSTGTSLNPCYIDQLGLNYKPQETRKQMFQTWRLFLFLFA